jgi:hypothetical protein
VSDDGGRPDWSWPPDLDDDRFRAALAIVLGGIVAVVPLLIGLIDAWTFLIAGVIGSLGILPIWRQVGAPLNRPLPLIAFIWLFVVGPAIVLWALSLVAFWTFLGAWVFTLGVLRLRDSPPESVVHDAEPTPAPADFLEFDRHLASLVDEFNDVLRVGRETRPEGANRARLKARAMDVATRARTLSPPDADWREVHDDFLELMSLHLAHFGEGLPEAVQGRFAALSQRVTVRRAELRKRDQPLDP